MRQDNLLAQRRTPFLKPPAERPSGFLVVPNLVRGLVPSAPDQIWVADITYVHLAKTFAYLAVILDAFSRKAVGWAFEDTFDASLAIAELGKGHCRPKTSTRQSDPSLRPRRAIRLHRLSPATGRPRHHHQHEQAGQSLR
ncbi:DDE-type integrase/transposase/recombinase [Bradyrhizobium yuanmingense]|uniref:DDE-type integrase/transposase/recombinase n=1 Tax=Bradyrhizobium yuanmingense TaxID=108015 RepID=UPI0023EC0E9D|nr:DDE-type integrase/transposase/recombinase [Bradyrhizobium yuanmingense]